MYWNDYNPPHFHAKYGEYEITVSIKNQVIEGKFPKRALKLVIEWLELNEEDLMENWYRAMNGQELKKIRPLE